MIDQHTLHSGLRFIHILAGSLGLVAFWIPVFAKKGGWLHITAGRVFVWLARIVAVSAIVSCTWGLLAPIHFSGITRQLSDEEAQILTGRIQFLFGLLGLLTTWFVSELQVGLRAVKTRRNQDQLGNLWTRTLVGAAALASAMALGYGAYKYGYAGERRYIIYIVLGIIGIIDGMKMFRVFAKSDLGRMDWWYLHMENMLGSGIAFHTAFFVFGGSRLWGELSGAWTVVPWVIPSAIGIPAIVIWTAYYRRKFEQPQGNSGILAQPLEKVY